MPTRVKLDQIEEYNPNLHLRCPSLHLPPTFLLHLCLYLLQFFLFDRNVGFSDLVAILKGNNYKKIQGGVPPPTYTTTTTPPP